MSQPPHEDWDEHDVRGPAARSTFEDDVLGLRRVSDHDESLADEMLAPEPEPGMFRPRRRKRRNPVLKVLALILAGCLFVVGGYYAVTSVGGLLPEISGGAPTADDYDGNGTGEVVVEIPEGAGGGQIAEILVQNDVVASVTAFTSVLQADPRSASIQPGTYRMAEHMSSASALDRLLDGNYREINGVTIREGLWVSETFALLAEATGNEVSDYEAVDPASLDLPEAADGRLEGYLFPSTYEFPPDATPQQQLQTMVDQGKKVYAELGIEESELHDVITKASIVQGEGMFAEDLPKVARVVENRLLPGNSETNGRLQMDSSIHYIHQERGRAGTTEAQRQEDSPYNTYLYPGLPPGPINNPGEEAIRAAQNPEPGPWLYFVTIDPSTGQTNFAETYEEHLANQELFLQWCEDNPDQC
ncbi:endolytic transglycosylase MltG [Ornithinimicrobium tianjinense]|uniref:Endolytic murein transglycosylase n=1 Tax=Ornithinimicrobium tianjinense TaxID=1195761 RepID=A0A917BLH5_9MICO|nr:endolytic transglycosylase MltG [Ornithinimicrobium tianjinense]GGF48561.1 ABC transporter substrate-binding protein [Ornithinimicrobium tianjinense]